MSIIQAAGSGEVSTGFYKHLIDQSLRFNEDDAPRLTRSIGTPTNETVWTFSCWLKRSTLNSVENADHPVVSGGTDASNYEVIAFWNSTDDVIINSTSTGSRNTATASVFRDLSSWYHLVVQRNDANQVIYINGVAVSTISNASASVSYLNKSGHTMTIGGHVPSLSTVCFDGYLSEVVFVDGTAVPIGSLGETKDGIWVAKDPSGLTFGNNGFYLTFKDDVVSEGFNTVTYEGTGSSTANFISGIGFAPNLVWIKNRDATANHALYDSLRTNMLSSNSATAEVGSSGVVALNADGFGIGSADARVNSAASFVAWCWEAGGTPTADNSAGAGATPTAGSVKIDGSNLGSALAGTIPATRLTANTSRGFSIISYTGNGGSSQTVAHGLSSAPEFIIHKDRGTNSNNGSWNAYHASVGDDYGYLSSTAAFTGSAQIIPNGTDTIELKSNLVTSNQNNHNFIMYAFHSVTGYSSFGAYSGSGSSGKAVTGLGFRPAWLMIKVSAGATGNWIIWDNTRNVVNTDVQNPLFPNLSNDEWTSGSPYQIEFDSDGFTINETSTQVNASGDTYLYVAFADTREAAFFKDVSTNGNHFTPVNLDYRDSVPDTPTNNFATFNPLLFNANVYSEGNLKNASAGNDWEIQVATMFPAGISGKWYAEFYVHTCNASGTRVGVGVTDANVDPEYYLGQASPDVAYYDINDIYTGGSKTADSNLTFAAGDIISVALNLDDGEVTFRKNNSTMTNGTQDLIANTLYTFATSNYGSGAGVIANFGQDSSFSGAKSTENTNADGNGHGSFQYAPPSGFLAICSQNLDSPAITDGTEHFNTVLYTGNATNATAISGVGFSPDWTWIKVRNNANNNRLFDTVRGAGKDLISNSTGSESTTTTRLQSFDSDGFTVGTNAEVNSNGHNIVAWNWLAGTAFSNDAGANGATIASSGQVNTTAGFSIVSFSCASGVTSGTVAHGLGVQPQLLIGKTRNHNVPWYVQTPLLATNLVGILNATDAFYNPGYNHWNDTHPTTSVFSVGGYMAGHSDLTLPSTKIVYAFANVEGYLKVGTYVGNNNADGTFVYTGFRPAWIMFRSSGVGHWIIFDVARHPSNVNDARLYANLSDAEDSSYSVDLLSNGFKLRHTGSDFNSSGVTYIYLAFAEQPFKFSNAR